MKGYVELFNKNKNFVMRLSVCGTVPVNMWLLLDYLYTSWESCHFIQSSKNKWEVKFDFLLWVLWGQYSSQENVNTNQKHVQ